MVDVILLISGSSKRMGREKAFLPFSEKQHFFCHLIEVYQCLADATIFVVVNDKNEDLIKNESTICDKRIVFVVNHESEKGRLQSILTGLKQVKDGRGAFIQNIDNPFVNEVLLTGMLQNYKVDSFLVPQFNGKNGHPLLLGADLIQELKANSNRISDLKCFLNSKKKECFITNDKAILANINCPEEYQKWFPAIISESEA